MTADDAIETTGPDRTADPVTSDGTVTMTDDDANASDEFAFLATEATEFGISTPVPPVRRQAVALPGTPGASDAVAISALAWGDAAPDVMLLHGAGLNAHTWDATLLALGRPAVALDLPGHGDSSWRPDGDYRAATIAPAVAEAIAQLAPAGATLVGQSLGGLTAIAVAALRPDLVQGLLLVDVSPGLVPGDAASVRNFLAGPTDFASRDEIVERAAAFGLGASRESLRRGVFHNTRVRPDGRVVFKHHLANLGGLDAVLDSDFRSLWPALDAVAVPVGLVHGTRGFLSPAVVAEFRDRRPQAPVTVIDAGHNVQEDAPVALAAAIGTFRHG